MDFEEMQRVQTIIRLLTDEIIKLKRGLKLSQRENERLRKRLKECGAEDEG